MIRILPILITPIYPISRRKSKMRDSKTVEIETILHRMNQIQNNLKEINPESPGTKSFRKTKTQFQRGHNQK